MDIISGKVYISKEKGTKVRATKNSEPNSNSFSGVAIEVTKNSMCDIGFIWNSWLIDKFELIDN